MNNKEITRIWLPIKLDVLLEKEAVKNRRTKTGQLTVILEEHYKKSAPHPTLKK